MDQMKKQLLTKEDQAQMRRQPKRRVALKP